MRRWKVLDSEKIVDDKWITIEKQKCDLGNGKIIDDYYIVKKKDYVVLIVEENEKISFLKQYRHGIGKFVLNLPMGLIDENETPEETAKRELLEETGYEVKDFDLLGSLHLAPSYIATKLYVFYTNKILGEIETKGDSEEEVERISLSKVEIKDLIEKNEIKDLSTLAALLLAKEKTYLL